MRDLVSDMNALLPADAPVVRVGDDPYAATLRLLAYIAGKVAEIADTVREKDAVLAVPTSGVENDYDSGYQPRAQIQQA